MQKFIFIALFVLLLLILFVADIMVSTGFFREINNSKNYEIIAELPLRGAEDFSISYEDDFLIISQDDRAAWLNNRSRTGGLYYISLKDDDFRLKYLHSTIMLWPHGISLLKLDTNRYQLLVVNHYQKHTIEKFELVGDSLSLIHISTYENDAILSPNDVVALNEDFFYFTNDHGTTSQIGVLIENYLGLSISNVILFDGAYKEVARDIAYANGINISRDRKQLLVASPRKFKINYYDIKENGLLEFSKSLHVGTGVDNIELDEMGNPWIGCHPNLLRFTAYAGGKKKTSPSEVIKILPDHSIQKIFINDGSLISASSVAVPYKDLLFIGTVMDDNLLVIRTNLLSLS